MGPSCPAVHQMGGLKQQGEGYPNEKTTLHQPLSLVDQPLESL